MAKIYKITDNLGQIYIGSTTRPLTRRFIEHKSHYSKCRSKLLMDNEPSIELIEECNIEDRLKRERYYITNYPECVNKAKNIGLGLTKNEYQKYYNDHNKEKAKEYYQKNQEVILKQKKEYWHKNKDQIKEYNKQYKQKNKEKIKEHYHKNKDQINAKRRERAKIKRINKMLNVKH